MKRESLLNYLQNEIRMRYSEKSILPFDDNQILHRLLRNENIPPKEIRELNILNINIIQMSQQLPAYVPIKIDGNPAYFDHPMMQALLNELDLMPTKEDFQKIRDNNIRICIVGYGGAMINTLYNMYLWSMDLSETRLFDKILVFEGDYIDFSNLARIGKPVVAKYTPEFAQERDPEFPDIKLLEKTALIDVEQELSKERRILVFERFLSGDNIDKMVEKDYIFVGAPNLETRNELFEKGANFFFLGHGDHEVEISHRPQITSGLATETYGSIDIPVLLFNLQLATAALIKQLANDPRPAESGVKFQFNMEEYLRSQHV